MKIATYNTKAGQDITMEIYDDSSYLIVSPESFNENVKDMTTIGGYKIQSYDPVRRQLTYKKKLKNKLAVEQQKKCALIMKLNKL